MDFLELLNNRKSERSYSETQVSKDEIKTILESVKNAPSSRNKKSAGVMCITDKSVLEQLSRAKESGSSFLKDASCCFVVIGDENISDVWIEDGSILMTILHLVCTNIGLKSCWIQIRNRNSKEGISSESVVQNVLNLSKNQRVLAILSVGK